jgi:uncharacterized protein (TIGR03083 family)
MVHMPSLTDETIAALRSLHDELGALVPTLTHAQLTGPSGASEWTIAQVLSHLGSGSEIALASYRTAVKGAAASGPEFNQSVWDRWNAMSPEEQASGFLDSDAKLVEVVEALTPDQRENLQIKLGFLPQPLGVAAIAGMRLNEVALHSWDVRVGIDPNATLSEGTAEVLVEQFSSAMSFFLGFIGKADALPDATIVDARGFGLVIDDAVSLRPTADDATATFEGPLEALVRLIGGRLTETFTPDSVSVVGNVSLDDLRRVFPGF